MAQILGNQPGVPQQPRVDLSQAQDMNCPHCNYPYFIQAVMMKKISRFVANTAKDAVLPVDVLLCGNCGKPLDELLPAELRRQAPQQPETEQTQTEEPVVTKSSLEI
jgi:DNA-directed RNA polymerase subunit RPC12/RpoP